MKLIGYWIQSLRDEKFPPPQELVIDYCATTRTRVANYLDAGSVFAEYRGISWCRFCCGHGLGNCDLTDGEWVWPQGLSHYVRDHNVRLPEQFIEYACSQLSPGDPPENGWPALIPDESFWISWCAKNRSNSLKSKIQSARNNADIEAQQIKVDTIASREQSEGLSDVTCQWAGCNNRALAGRVVCATCFHKSDWEGLMSRPYFNLRPVLND